MSRAVFRRIPLLTAILALLIAGPAAAQALAPSAVTGAATAIDRDVATLHGSVNPRGTATEYWFEYGTTNALGSRTATVDAGNGDAAFDVDQQIGSLRAGTAYRYRLVARNSAGTTQGAIRSFRTDAAPVQRPAATTERVRDVTQTTATLVGTLNNRSQAATYHFEWGPTSRYGQTTPETPLPADASAHNVTFPLTGLTADTSYHVRVVMTIGTSVTRGSDRSFRTLKVPNGLLLQSSRNPTWMGGAVDLFGVLAGSGNSGRPVSVQADPFPYGDGWVDVASGRTDATGAYRIRVSPLLRSTQLRTVANGVTSQAVTVQVRVASTFHVSTKRVRRGRTVRFFGSVEPAQPGASVAIQRRTPRGGWQTVARTRQHGVGDRASYGRRVRLWRSGTYRTKAYANDGAHVSRSSPGRFIRVHR